MKSSNSSKSSARQQSSKSSESKPVHRGTSSFSSKVPRFPSEKRSVVPGPGQYNPCVRERIKGAVDLSRQLPRSRTHSSGEKTTSALSSNSSVASFHSTKDRSSYGSKQGVIKPPPPRANSGRFTVQPPFATARKTGIVRTTTMTEGMTRSTQRTPLKLPALRSHTADVLSRRAKTPSKPTSRLTSGNPLPGSNVGKKTTERPNTAGTDATKPVPANLKTAPRRPSSSTPTRKPRNPSSVKRSPARPRTAASPSTCRRTKTKKVDSDIEKELKELMKRKEESKTSAMSSECSHSCSTTKSDLSCPELWPPSGEEALPPGDNHTRRKSSPESDHSDRTTTWPAELVRALSEGPVADREERLGPAERQGSREILDGDRVLYGLDELGAWPPMTFDSTHFGRPRPETVVQVHTATIVTEYDKPEQGESLATLQIEDKNESQGSTPTKSDSSKRNSPKEPSIPVWARRTNPGKEAPVPGWTRRPNPRETLAPAWARKTSPRIDGAAVTKLLMGTGSTWGKSSKTGERRAQKKVVETVSLPKTEQNEKKPTSIVRSCTAPHADRLDVLLHKGQKYYRPSSRGSNVEKSSENSAKTTRPTTAKRPQTSEGKRGPHHVTFGRPSSAPPPEAAISGERRLGADLLDTEEVEIRSTSLEEGARGEGHDERTSEERGTSEEESETASCCTSVPAYDIDVICSESNLTITAKDTASRLAESRSAGVQAAGHQSRGGVHESTSGGARDTKEASPAHENVGPRPAETRWGRVVTGTRARDNTPTKAGTNRKTTAVCFQQELMAKLKNSRPRQNEMKLWPRQRSRSPRSKSPRIKKAAAAAGNAVCSPAKPDSAATKASDPATSSGSKTDPSFSSPLSTEHPNFQSLSSSSRPSSHEDRPREIMSSPLVEADKVSHKLPKLLPNLKPEGEKPAGQYVKDSIQVLDTIPQTAQKISDTFHTVLEVLRTYLTDQRYTSMKRSDQQEHMMAFINEADGNAFHIRQEVKTELHRCVTQINTNLQELLFMNTCALEERDTANTKIEELHSREEQLTAGMEEYRRLNEEVQKRCDEWTYRCRKEQETRRFIEGSKEMVEKEVMKHRREVREAEEEVSRLRREVRELERRVEEVRKSSLQRDARLQAKLKQEERTAATGVEMLGRLKEEKSAAQRTLQQMNESHIRENHSNMVKIQELEKQLEQTEVALNKEREDKVQIEHQLEKKDDYLKLVEGATVDLIRQTNPGREMPAMPEDFGLNPREVAVWEQLELCRGRLADLEHKNSLLEEEAASTAESLQAAEMVLQWANEHRDLMESAPNEFTILEQPNAELLEEMDEVRAENKQLKEKLTLKEKHCNMAHEKIEKLQDLLNSLRISETEDADRVEIATLQHQIAEMKVSMREMLQRIKELDLKCASQEIQIRQRDLYNQNQQRLLESRNQVIEVLKLKGRDVSTLESLMAVGDTWRKPCPPRKSMSSVSQESGTPNNNQHTQELEQLVLKLEKDESNSHEQRQHLEERIAELELQLLRSERYRHRPPLPLVVPVSERVLFCLHRHAALLNAAGVHARLTKLDFLGLGSDDAKRLDDLAAGALTASQFLAFLEAVLDAVKSTAPVTLRRRPLLPLGVSSTEVYNIPPLTPISTSAGDPTLTITTSMAAVVPQLDLCKPIGSQLMCSDIRSRLPGGEKEINPCEDSACSDDHSLQGESQSVPASKSVFPLEAKFSETLLHEKSSSMLTNSDASKPSLEESLTHIDSDPCVSKEVDKNEKRHNHDFLDGTSEEGVESTTSTSSGYSTLLSSHLRGYSGDVSADAGVPERGVSEMSERMKWSERLTSMLARSSFFRDHLSTIQEASSRSGSSTLSSLGSQRDTHISQSHARDEPSSQDTPTCQNVNVTLKDEQGTSSNTLNVEQNTTATHGYYFHSRQDQRHRTTESTERIRLVSEHGCAKKANCESKVINESILINSERKECKYNLFGRENERKTNNTLHNEEVRMKHNIPMNELRAKSSGRNGENHSTFSRPVKGKDANGTSRKKQRKLRSRSKIRSTTNTSQRSGPSRSLSRTGDKRRSRVRSVDGGGQHVEEKWEKEEKETRTKRKRKRKRENVANGERVCLGEGELRPSLAELLSNPRFSVTLRAVNSTVCKGMCNREELEAMQEAARDLGCEFSRRNRERRRRPARGPRPSPGGRRMFETLGGVPAFAKEFLNRFLGSEHADVQVGFTAPVVTHSTSFAAVDKRFAYLHTLVETPLDSNVNTTMKRSTSQALRKTQRDHQQGKRRSKGIFTSNIRPTSFEVPVIESRCAKTAEPEGLSEKSAFECTNGETSNLNIVTAKKVHKSVDVAKDDQIPVKASKGKVNLSRIYAWLKPSLKVVCMKESKKSLSNGETSSAQCSKDNADTLGDETVRSSVANASNRIAACPATRGGESRGWFGEVMFRAAAAGLVRTPADGAEGATNDVHDGCRGGSRRAEVTANVYDGCREGPRRAEVMANVHDGSRGGQNRAEVMANVHDGCRGGSRRAEVTANVHDDCRGGPNGAEVDEASRRARIVLVERPRHLNGNRLVEHAVNRAGSREDCHEYTNLLTSAVKLN